MGLRRTQRCSQNTKTQTINEDHQQEHIINMVKVHMQKKAHPSASADDIWKVWTKFSDVSWHPWVAHSENAGPIPDGSANMVGATRRLVEAGTGNEMVERVVEWDDEKRFMKISIEEGGPDFAKCFLVSLRVYENVKDGSVMVEMDADLHLKTPYKIMAPLMKVMLPRQLDGLVQGFAELK